MCGTQSIPKDWSRASADLTRSAAADGIIGMHDDAIIDEDRANQLLESICPVIRAARSRRCKGADEG
jgi:hypothetical protein